MKKNKTWLILDPTGPLSGFAVAEGKSVVGSKVFKSNFLFENLLKIRSFFEKLNRSIDDMEGVILVNGPGSIMGLRIAFSWLKGFFYNKKLKFKTVSSLDVLWFCAGKEQPSWTMINSIRDEVFFSLNGSSPSVIKKSEIIKKILKNPGLCIGDFPNDILKTKGVKTLPVKLPQFEAVWMFFDLIEEKDILKTEPLILYSFPGTNIE